jgi:hypothetical protein
MASTADGSVHSVDPGVHRVRRLCANVLNELGRVVESFDWASRKQHEEWETAIEECVPSDLCFWL